LSVGFSVGLSVGLLVVVAGFSEAAGTVLGTCAGCGAAVGFAATGWGAEAGGTTTGGATTGALPAVAAGAGLLAAGTLTGEVAGALSEELPGELFGTITGAEALPKGGTLAASGISMGMSTVIGRGWWSNSNGSPTTPSSTKTADPIRRCSARLRNISMLCVA
jgi:hypothetical protein